MKLLAIKILIVEDEQAHVQAIKRSLENAVDHITLDVATTICEYRSKTATFKPDVVLFDIHLPDGNAIDVLTSPPETGDFPILVMTCYGSEQIAVEALKAGAMDYLVKTKDSFAAIPRIVERSLREWHLLKQRIIAEEKLKRSEKLLRRTGKIAKIGGWELDLVSMRMTWSEEVYRIHEQEINITITVEEMIKLYSPEVRPIIENAISFGINKGQSWNLELPLISHCGKQTWVRLKGAVEMQSDKPVRLVGICQDITELKHAEQQLHIAATTFEVQESIVITDCNMVILQVNKAFQKLTGYSSEEIIGKDYALLESSQYDEQFYANIWDDVMSDKYWQGEVWNLNKKGLPYPQWQTINAVTASEGKITHYVISFSDITQHKEAEEKIRKLAFYDGLTGLANRQLLSDRLQHSFSASSRHNTYSAVLFVDLDNFKKLNDTKGHDVGDLLLIEVAQRLLNCVRENDTVSRFGGDEFVVVLEELHDELKSATALTQKIVEKILVSIAEPFLLGDYEFQTSASIGISFFIGHSISEDEILKRSDTAMYQAKQSGRNTFCFFNPQLQVELEERIRLEDDLRRALEQKQLELFFQIQIEDEYQIIGAEVLLRWKHPERSEILPSQFIPLAEASGLIVPIGCWVLEMACAQIKAWESNPFFQNIVLSINVSAKQFRYSGFTNQICKVLEATGINPQRLKFELTESLVHENIPDTIEKMHELKELGIVFSMDDFGTGYSSLSNLKLLPLQQLKIDQSFIRDIKVDSNDAVIVKTIIVMAKSLGLHIIAEGVETEEQRDFLLENGCRSFQGALFGLPMPVQQFEQLVMKMAQNPVII